VRLVPGLCWPKVVMSLGLSSYWQTLSACQWIHPGSTRVCTSSSLLPDFDFKTVEADESVRDRASSSLPPDFDFKMLEDSFFLLGKMVRVAVLGCGHESDSTSQSSPLLRSLRFFSLWLEVLSL
jgi:hypothetical protein